MVTDLQHVQAGVNFRVGLLQTSRTVSSAAVRGNLVPQHGCVPPSRNPFSECLEKGG